MFGIVNYTILAIYLAVLLLIGWWFAGRQQSGEDYFLAGRCMPWLPVAMSMYASLTSAVTYMGLPGLAYRSNVTLIVAAVISPLLAPILIGLFYPFYRRLKVTTSYEYIGCRFGGRARTAVSALFVLGRLGWLGTVIYAPAIALTAVTGIPLWTAILLMGLLATTYTMLGGMAAVLWTDVFQFVILIGGAIWVAVTLTTGIPGGIESILQIGRDAGHIQLDWSLNLYEMTVLGVAISFFFQMMQDYGTDQVTVQRLLSVRSFRGMVKAVLFNACTDFFIVTILLFIGLALFAFYQVHPNLPRCANGDQIFPFYIMQQLPNGLSGLLIAAIFAAAMSSMDSGINSVATVLVNDFIKPFRPVSPKHEVSWARLFTLLLGLFATGMAFYISTLDGIIEAFAMFMGMFSAPVLALFIMGMLSRRARFEAWLISAMLAVAFSWWIQHHTPISWIYYFPFAFGFTLLLGWSGSYLFPPKQDKQITEYTIWREKDKEGGWQ